MKNIFFGFFDRLLDVCATVAGWMILAMALIITYEVCVRYFFASPTIWVNDFTDYIMLFSTFFVSAWLLKHDGHVHLTILQERLSSKSKLVMNAMNYFLGAIACALLFYYGAGDVWDAVVNKIKVPRPIPVPKWLILMVVPFGFLLLFIQFLRGAFKFLAELKAKPK